MTQAPVPTRLAKDAGVTLVEMMVVIVIIGLVAAIVALNVLPAQDRARVEKAKADIAQLEQALELFRLENARYPAMDEGLEALMGVAGAGQAAAANAGVVKRIPKDPWGRPYQYVVPGERGPFDLYSLGADAKLGGEGLDADIGNWS